MNLFNGSYEPLADGQEILSEAHREALELLDIVHGICVEKKIVYSLVNESLISIVEGKSFADLSPTLVLAMKYESQLVLREELEKFIDKNAAYVLIDRKNSHQFDSLALWFAKKNRVRLPENRKQDEIYYYTHISLVPVFSAGNSRKEYNEIVSIYKTAIRALKARAPLPQRTLRTKIRIIKKILENAWYRRLRERINLDDVVQKLSIGRTHSELCFFPVMSNRLDTMQLKIREIEEADLIELSGHPCYISRYADEIAVRYPVAYREAVLKQRVSDLIRKGGESLRRVQLIQTEMLVEFDRVCRKNNIRYNIAFGTLLGAVRHKGFIPWDDDVDVIVPIEDYVRLDAAMEKDLDTSRFFWRTMETEKDFNLTFKHMKRNGTVYMKPGRNQFQFHKGVLIDVFPVFHSANNRLAHWFQTRLCFFYRTATWAYMGADSERSRWKRFLYNQMKKPGPEENLKTFMKYATMFPEKNPYYSYFNAAFRSPYHVAYLSEEAFQTPTELEFEGHKFWGPSNYEAALTYCFGADYRLYPFIRNPEHFAIVELGDLFSLDAGENTMEKD